MVFSYEAHLTLGRQGWVWQLKFKRRVKHNLKAKGQQTSNFYANKQMLWATDAYGNSRLQITVENYLYVDITIHKFPDICKGSKIIVPGYVAAYRKIGKVEKQESKITPAQKIFPSVQSLHTWHILHAVHFLHIWYIWFKFYEREKRHSLKIANHKRVL